MDCIPVVDFSPISTKNGRVPSEVDWELVAKEIDRVLTGIGFVYIKNHGIPQEKIDRAFKESKLFFELDTKVKLKYLKDYKKSYTGYAEPNQEQLDPSSSYEYRESYDFSRNMVAGAPILPEMPDEEVPDFHSSNYELEKECRPLIDKFHKILAKGLGLEDEDYFIKKSQFLCNSTLSSCTTYRTLYYPAIPKTMEIEPGTVRCAPHSDYGTLTVLFQDQIGGLEIKNAEGTWVEATPIPETILVNTGDLLYFWSGGRYPATVHRVLIPETEIKKRVPRQSIAYFLHPDDDVMVVPLNSTKVTADEHIKPVSAYEHAMMRLERSYKY